MKEAGRHIDKVLKEKLGNHSLPVTEQDWTEFQSLFQKHRRTRRGIVWFVSICLISIAGLGIWLIRSGAPSGPETTTEQQDNNTTGTTPEEFNNGSRGQSEDGGNTSTEQKQHIHSQSDGIASQTPVKGSQPQPQPQQQDLPSNGSNASNGTNSSNGSNTGDPVEGGVQPGRTPGADPVVNRYPPLPAPFIAGMPFHLPSSFHPKENKPDYVAAYTAKDSSKNSNHLKKPFQQPKLGPGIAFGMVYGFGQPALSVPDYDTTIIHKEYRDKLENTPRQSSTFRLYARYEHRLNLGVEVAGGLEFSSTVQKQQYNFEMRTIPYFDTNGNIFLYIPLPANQQGDITRFDSKVQIYSIRVPVSIGYSRFLGENFRLGARVQSSFGLNWSNSSYKGLRPASLEETTMKAPVNPFSLTYGGGLFAEYFYLERKWSMRGSFDWTGQNGQFKKKNPYNLNNRFYELNLAIVRYL